MVFCPVLKDPKHCDTSPLGMILDCSKCLYMFQAGMGQGWVTSPFVGQDLWWVTLWLSLGHSQGKHCRRNWFPDCRGICTFVFDQKKKKT